MEEFIIKIKVIFAACVLFILFSLSCVSAVNNDHGDMAVLSQNSVDNGIVGVNGDVGTFTQLKDKINTGVNEYKLDKDYKFDSSKDNAKLCDRGIEVTRNNYVIDGQGHTIDGADKACLLLVTGDNVTVKNINFINANGYDAAVDCFGYNPIVDNCNFTNNNAFIDSSALCSDGGIISNCNFNHNKDALYALWDEVKIVNCSFSDNFGKYGPVYVSCKGTIDNCIFSNNAVESGGAIVCLRNLNITNSKFYNNSAKKGGAIYILGNTVNIENCQFFNNSAEYGGAIYNEGNLNVYNSSFNKNTANGKLNNIFEYKKSVLNADEYSLIHIIPVDFKITDLQTNTSSLNFKLYISHLNDTALNRYVFVTVKDRTFTFSLDDGFADINITDLDTGIYTINMGYVISGLYFRLTDILVFSKNNGDVTAVVKD